MSRIMQKKSGLEQCLGMAYSFRFMLTCKGGSRPAGAYGKVLLAFEPLGLDVAYCNQIEQRFEPTMRQTRLQVG